MTMAAIQPITGPVLDSDHPWIGLHPFTEENQHYFFGRSAETREIFLRIREHPLTVLYGQSGLGKTSLLRAGLIPKLRIQRFRAVHLLLDFSEAPTDLSMRSRYEPGVPPLIDQVRAALAQACASPEISASEWLKLWAQLGSLWEICNHESLRPAELVERPPVLVFDQFEEVFTLGASGPHGAPSAEVQEIFTQLADLLENRPPKPLQQQFAANPQSALDFDFGRVQVRVVLALREDYLAQLEAWKATMPSLMRNRMALRLLTGPQALEAVVRPGRMGDRPLVSDEIGAQIVRFVAKCPPDTPLEEIQAVPPLISLLCEQLNLARKESEVITSNLVETQSSDILQHFYNESFSGMPDVVREFVEDRMVTVGGHRNPVARDDAIAALRESNLPTPEEALDRLIARRLLTAEQRGGIQRIEITHDVLLPLVTRSRRLRRERRVAEEAQRKQQQAELRRRRQFIAALAGMTVLLLAAFLAIWYVVGERRRAQQNAIEALRLQQAAETAEKVAVEAYGWAEAIALAKAELDAKKLLADRANDDTNAVSAQNTSVGFERDPAIKTRIMNVDVVSRDIDRSRMTFGIEYEYKDALSGPRIALEVMRQAEPEVSRYFVSGSAEISKSRRNFAVLEVKFQPPAGLPDSAAFSTDKVLVYLQEGGSGKRFNVFLTTMLLVWRAERSQLTAVQTSGNSIEIDDFKQTDASNGYVTVKYNLLSGSGRIRAKIYEAKRPESAAYFVSDIRDVPIGRGLQLVEVRVDENSKSSTELINADTVEVELLDPEGKVVAKTSKQAAMVWSKPK